MGVGGGYNPILGLVQIPFLKTLLGPGLRMGFILFLLTLSLHNYYKRK